MESQNPFLNDLFNGLSSVYNKDDGMTNSNMWIVLNSYALVFQDIQRLISQTQANTYVATADPDQLENNFGVLIGFPKPPRLNSLSNGDEIYRAILRALYQNYQLAPTTTSIQTAVAIILSFLVTDPSTSDYYLEEDDVFLNIPDTQVQLPYTPLPVISTQFPNANAADPSTYISFSPQGILTVTGFDSVTNTITFTGNPSTAQEYTVVYYRDNTTMRGTNWINVTNASDSNVLPLDLKTTNNTFDNYQFSYWWNVYNRDGLGVQIIENLLANQDQGIVWRLPEKTISYINPYNSAGSILEQQSIDLYDNSGQVYDINTVSAVNPDVLLSTIPMNYFSDVAVNLSNFYIRYSSDNAINIPYAQFEGSFSGFQKNNYSLAFGSVNYGTLDFFEKGVGFNQNDLFGYGTKHIWMDVPYLKNDYTLNNDNFLDRKVSLHEMIIFQDSFEEGNLNKWSISPTGYGTIAETILNPQIQKEDCIKLFSTISGSTTIASAILPSAAFVSGNHIRIDLLDVFNSGTSTYVDVVRTSGANFNQFRFGIDPSGMTVPGFSGVNILTPYYYQTSNVPNGIISAPKNYLTAFPRTEQWHTLTYDFGVSIPGLNLYSGMNVFLDQEQFLNTSDMGFGSNLSSLTLNHVSSDPSSEFSYFDNARVSYYNSVGTLPIYQVGQNLAQDWGGAILDQSTAIEDRVFAQESISNFHFLVNVLGWTDDLVFIVQKIVDQLKPAYSYASVLFEQNQSLDTATGTILANPITDWNSGNTNNNIIIKLSGSFQGLDTSESLPGFITVSPSGNLIF